MPYQHYNRISLIGIGQVGYRLAILIAKYKLSKYLHLCDIDRVDHGTTIPLYIPYIGLYKVDALAEVIQTDDRLRMNVSTTTHPNTLVSNASKSDIVIDCRDYKKDAMPCTFKVSYDGKRILVYVGEYTPCVKKLNIRGDYTFRICDDPHRSKFDSIMLNFLKNKIWKTEHEVYEYVIAQLSEHLTKGISNECTADL